MSNTEYQARIDELNELRDKVRFDQSIPVETMRFILAYTGERRDNLYRESHNE